LSSIASDAANDLASPMEQSESSYWPNISAHISAKVILFVRVQRHQGVEGADAEFPHQG
jgi:hypothetical protein